MFSVILFPRWGLIHINTLVKSLCGVVVTLGKTANQIKMSFFSFVSSFFLSSFEGMSHVADAPPLCSEMGEGKRGCRAMKERCDWGVCGRGGGGGSRTKQGGVLLHCCCCCCWRKSTPDRCISSAPARPGGCFKTSSPQPFLPLSMLTRHQRGGSSPDLHKFILLFSPDRIPFMSSEASRGPQSLVTRDSWICASAGQMLVSVSPKLFLQLVWDQGAFLGVRLVCFILVSIEFSPEKWGQRCWWSGWVWPCAVPSSALGKTWMRTRPPDREKPEDWSSTGDGGRKGGLKCLMSLLKWWKRRRKNQRRRKHLRKLRQVSRSLCKHNGTTNTVTVHCSDVNLWWNLSTYGHKCAIFSLTFPGLLSARRFQATAWSRDSEDTQTGKAAINLWGRRTFGLNSVI